MAGTGAHNQTEHSKRTLGTPLTFKEKKMSEWDPPRHTQGPNTGSWNSKKSNHHRASLSQPKDKKKIYMDQKGPNQWAPHSFCRWNAPTATTPARKVQKTQTLKWAVCSRNCFILFPPPFPDIFSIHKRAGKKKNASNASFSHRTDPGDRGRSEL